MMDHHGIRPDIIGLSTAVQASAIFLFAPFAPRIIARFGPSRVIFVNLCGTVLLFLLFPLTESVIHWFVLRFLLGITNNLLWIAGESMVNHVTDDSNRGRSISKYAMALSGGFAAGPFILTLTGTVGWTPFVAAGSIAALSMLPMLWVDDVKADFNKASTINFRQVLARAPVPMFANLAFAASSGIMITFLPLYGLRLGLDEGLMLTYITIAAVGGMAFQPIFGRLADRMHRLLLLTCVLVLAVLVSLLMPLFVALPIYSLIYFFVFGGVRTGLYAISVTLMGEKFKGAELASASALYNLMWGVGNGLGPYIGGYAIDWWNPHGIPLSIAVMIALVIPFAVINFIKSSRNTTSSI